MYTIFAADKQIPAERNSVPKTTGADAERQNPYPTAMHLRSGTTSYPDSAVSRARKLQNEPNAQKRHDTKRERAAPDRPDRPRGGGEPATARPKPAHPAQTPLHVEALSRKVQRPRHQGTARSGLLLAGHLRHRGRIRRNDRHLLRHLSGDGHRLLVRVRRQPEIRPAKHRGRRDARIGRPQRENPGNSPQGYRSGRHRHPQHRRRGSRGRHAARSRLAADKRIEPDRGTHGKQDGRGSILRQRSHLSVRLRAARNDGYRRPRRHAGGTCGRCDRNRKGGPAGDRTGNRTDTAEHPAFASGEADWAGGFHHCDTHLPHLYGQGPLRLPLRPHGDELGTVARHRQHRPEILHDGSHLDCGRRPRRAAHERYPQPRAQHAPHAPDEQPRAQDARLRNDGGDYGHLHRQDGHPDTKSDAGL